jgi:YidC/Oxa1 family membrane protein insertase
MAQPTNRFLRILIPAILIILGIGVVAAVSVNSMRQTQRTPQQPVPVAPTPAAPSPPVESPPPQAQGVSPAPATTGELPAPGPAAAPIARIEGLRPELLEQGPETTDFTPIGDIDPNGPMTMRIDFSPLGAGVRAITLARHFETIRRTEHIVVQHEHSYTPLVNPGESPAAPRVIVPFSALAVEINGQLVPILGFARGANDAPVWRQTAPGQFEAHIVDGDQRRIARLVRHYELSPGSYVVNLRQWAQNLTDSPLQIRWIQFGPVELDQDVVAYGGDRRRVRFGYLMAPRAQRNDPTVAASDFVWDRLNSDVAGPLLRTTQPRMYEDLRTVWPNRRSIEREYRLVWAGMTNRYFGAAMHPLLTGDVHPDQKIFHVASTVDRVFLQRLAVVDGTLTYNPVMILRTQSSPMTIPGGQSADLSMAVFAGPLSRGLIGQHVSAAAAGLRDLVVYNFGGPCAPCTFGFLTSLLLNLLLFLHHYIVFDWALAIVILVLVVRTTLHPVTRWSQIRLQRFGKQMQDMAPKQKKLQEKFKEDPKRMREEMAKLWREEGINPTGMLGCVPMLLQTPIWIALFAMLFFAFELRQEAAFFGFFQWVSGGAWWFLGDLAEPDRFVYFGRDLFWLPLLGPIRSFNILPLLLGAVFFMQQKYLTPPSSAPLTPEQQQQQKMIKVMMVVLFPLFMYNAPSGLALYFIVNSSLGILESKWIRKHIEKHKLLEVKKGPAKAGSFMARLQQLAEDRQRQMQGKRKDGGAGGGPRKRV